MQLSFKYPVRNSSSQSEVLRPATSASFGCLLNMRISCLHLIPTELETYPRGRVHYSIMTFLLGMLTHTKMEKQLVDVWPKGLVLICYTAIIMCHKMRGLKQLNCSPLRKLDAWDEGFGRVDSFWGLWGINILTALSWLPWFLVIYCTPWQVDKAAPVQSLSSHPYCFLCDYLSFF